MDEEDPKPPRLSLEQYAEVTAYLVHFPSEDRYALLRKLGVAPEDWTAAETVYLEYLALAQRYNQVLGTQKFINSYAKTRRRLQHYLPEFSYLAPLWPTETESTKASTPAEKASEPPPQGAPAIREYPPPHLAAALPPGIGFSSVAGGVMSPWVDPATQSGAPSVPAHSPPMVETNQLSVVPSANTSEPPRQDDAGLDETAFVTAPLAPVDPLPFRKVAAGEVAVPTSAVDEETNNEQGHTSILGISAVAEPSLPFRKPDGTEEK